MHYFLNRLRAYAQFIKKEMKIREKLHKRQKAATKKTFPSSCTDNKEQQEQKTKVK